MCMQGKARPDELKKCFKILRGLHSRKNFIAEKLKKSGKIKSDDGLTDIINILFICEKIVSKRKKGL